MRDFFLGIGAVILLGSFLSNSVETSWDDRPINDVPKLEISATDASVVAPIATGEPKRAPSIEEADANLVSDEKASALTSPETTRAAVSRIPAVSRPTDLPQVYVTASRLNLRSGPSTSNRIVGAAQRSSTLQPTGQRDGRWIEVKLPRSSDVAWAHTGYLSTTKPPVVTKSTSGTRTPKRGIAAPTNGEITAARRTIIRQSIAAYPGSCACPYNTDRAGRRCGKRSAWSRPGGFSPVCYDSDISQSRLNSHLARIRGATN